MTPQPALSFGSNWKVLLIWLLVSMVIETFAFDSLYNVEPDGHIGDPLHRVRASESDANIFALFYTPSDPIESMAEILVVRAAFQEVQIRYRSSSRLMLEEVALSSRESLTGCSNSTGKTCLLFVPPADIDRTCLLNLENYNSLDGTRRVMFEGPMTQVEIVAFMESNLGISLYSFIGADLDSDRYRVGVEPSGCPEIEASELTVQQFLKSFFIPQRPLIIKNAAKIKPLIEIVQLLRDHSTLTVGAKFSPDEAFEGVDDVSNWNMGAEPQRIPPYVLSRLQSPDKVVGRAAHEELELGQVLELIANHQKIAVNRSSTAKEVPPNIYVEYLDMSRSSGLHSLFEKVLPEANPLPGWAQFFYEVHEYNLRHNQQHQSDVDSEVGRNHLFYDRMGQIEPKPMLWLGDGRTVGKLHFDPFDNILYQIKGEKIFKISDPEDNERFYEGHMREAVLDATPAKALRGNGIIAQCAVERIAYKNKSQSCVANRQTLFEFRKEKLLESTSMVHSPIDIENPDFDKYPMAKSVKYMSCHVKEGEVLYLPSFWWHEVRSKPSDEMLDGVFRLNMAINFWFEPLFTKSFPCASCLKKFNSKLYSSVLRDASLKGLLMASPFLYF